MHNGWCLNLLALVARTTPDTKHFGTRILARDSTSELPTTLDRVDFDPKPILYP
jgi:hypothetical protein